MGSRSALEESRVIALRGKQKGSVQEEVLAVSATITVNVEQVQNRRQKNDGTNSSKGRPPRGSSSSGKRRQKPCKDKLKGNCTNPTCDSWHLPCAKITNHKRAASLAESVHSCTRRRTDSRRKERRVEKKVR